MIILFVSMDNRSGHLEYKKKKTHNYGRSINPYIIFLGATKSQEQKRTAFFHDFGSLQLISSKICSFSPFTNEKTFSTKFCQ